jgi:hypothetical protein
VHKLLRIEPQIDLQEIGLFCHRYTPMDTDAGAEAWFFRCSWLRRLIHGYAVPWDRVPRAAFGRGRFSRQAWNASPHSALIRLPFLSWRSKERYGEGIAAHSLSRTHVSKQDAMEQAGLQNGGLRSSPWQAEPDMWTRSVA